MTKTRLRPKGHHGAIRNNATQGVKAGNLIFVGGQMSLDEQGRVSANDIATQTRNALESVRSVLAEAGASMQDVVKHNVYYDFEGSDEEESRLLAEMNQVLLEYFTEPGPTSTQLRAGLAVEGAAIQIEAVAAVDAQKQRLMPAGHWNWHEPMPFSHGWKVGNIVFVGGQRSLDEQGRVVGVGDIAAQTANAFRNLEAVLKEAGGDRNTLLRQNTYYRFVGEGRDVTDYWENMTRVRIQYMSVPSPCGTGVRAMGLPLPEELIQVEGIGVLGGDKQRLMPANHWDWSIPNNHFSQGWRTGHLVFVGGQISADSNARTVGADMATQTRNVFRFICNTLREGGADQSDVVKINAYYYAEGDRARIAETDALISDIQKEFFPEPGPAATSVRVTGFAYEDLLIEIEAIAVLDR